MPITRILLVSLCCAFGTLMTLAHSRHQMLHHNAPTLSSTALKQDAQRMFNNFTVHKEHPDWESWDDQCDLHLLEGCPSAAMPPCKGVAASSDNQRSGNLSLHLAHALQRPPQEVLSAQTLEDGSPSPRPYSVLQTIFYNRPAAHAIRKYVLYSKTCLDNMLQSSVKTGFPTIPDGFEGNSIIVKTSWELIKPRKHAANPNLYGSLGLYSTPQYSGNDASVPNAIGQLNGVGQWSHTQVDISDTDRCTVKQPEDIYSLGCFYSRKVTKEDYQNIPHDARVDPNLDELECFSNCYLILVGVHIMSSDVPSWTWMTFWWSAKPEIEKRLGFNKWQFFDVNATRTNTDYVANPYLEGWTTGMKSNCLECHRFAAYDGVNRTQTRFTLGEPHPDGKGGLLPVATDLHDPEAAFHNSLQTHFLWTIPTNQNGKLTTPGAQAPKTQAVVSSHSR